MKRPLLACVIGILISTFSNSYAQTKIKDGTVTGSPALPNIASVLELESANKGLLLPRVALTNTTTWGLTGSAVTGMQVYNTAAAITSTNTAYPVLPNGTGAYYWDGAGWVGMASPPAIGNIYTTDGTLGARRTVTMAGNSLIFSDTGGTTSLVNTPLGGGPSLVLTTSSPTGRSNVQLTAGNSNMYMFLDGGNAAQLTANASRLNIGLFVPSPITFFTNNITRLTIDPAGNVGIGNDAPNSTLQVMGSFSATIASITGDYTAQSTDYTLISRSGSANAITLPDPAGCPGRIYHIINNNTNAASSDITVSPSVDAGGGVFISTFGINTISGTGYSGNKYTIQSDGTYWVLISNN